MPNIIPRQRSRRRKLVVASVMLAVLSFPAAFGFSGVTTSNVAVGVSSHRLVQLLGRSNTALYSKGKPSKKGTGKSTQPEPAFSFGAFNRKATSSDTNRNKKKATPPAKKRAVPPVTKPPVAAKSTESKIPTLRLVENLQQTFKPKEASDDTKKGATKQTTKQQSETTDSIPFFAMNKGDDDKTAKETVKAPNPTVRIVESPQKAVQNPLSKQTVETTSPAQQRAAVTNAKPPVKPPPPIKKAPVKPPSIPSTSISSSTTPANPMERVQDAIESKQAQVQQKALQTKEKVVGAVETTKATIDSGVSALQQFLDDVAKIPSRIQKAYANAVQFLQSIPPKVEDTANKIAAIPGKVQEKAKETKDTVTAIPGKIEATKNDITDKIDRTVATGKQTIQNIIDFPGYVRQKFIDTKNAVDDFIYDVKVLFKQAPPRPKPPKSPPKKPDNPIVGALFWVLKGVAGLTGKAVSATAEAVVEQVKKQQPEQSQVKPRKKDGSKSVDDLEREADEALKLAEEALQSFKSQRNDKP